MIRKLSREYKPSPFVEEIHKYEVGDDILSIYKYYEGTWVIKYNNDVESISEELAKNLIILLDRFSRW